MTTHWAYRRLAAQLRKAGFDTFRIDYFGTGDSAGVANEISVDTIIGDIRAALHLLTERFSHRSLSLAGYSIGGYFAARAASVHDKRIRDLVLWDPLVHGQSYISELQKQDALFTSRLLNVPNGYPDKHPREYLGFIVNETLLHQITSLNLGVDIEDKALRTHFLRTIGTETVSEANVVETLKERLKRFSYTQVNEVAESREQLLASKMIRAIPQVFEKADTQ